MFDRIEDPYFRDRRSDVAIVGERLLRSLMGMEDSAAALDGVPRGSIVVAHDLSPADVAQLGRAGVAGFCTEAGGRTSHTSIVCRALGLPYVAGVEGLGHRVWSGMNLVIDGSRGEVIIEADEAVRHVYEERADHQRERSQRLRAMRDAPAETLDGVRIHLAANVELLEEVPASVDLGAESVGLFRSEFLYLERADSAYRGRAVRARGRGAEERARAQRSPSGRWISAATSCPRASASRAARTRRWACARFASRSIAPTCSGRNCGRCIGRRRWGRCRSCSR